MLLLWFVDVTVMVGVGGVGVNMSVVVNAFL